MTRSSLCGLLLIFAHVAVRHAAAQDAAGPRSTGLTLEQAFDLAREGGVLR